MVTAVEPAGADVAHPTTVCDVAVIGAGMGGLYAVKRFIDDGASVVGIDSAPDVGGVWYHNRYPGARVDIEAYYYCFFDRDLYREWKWENRYPSQPELLSYLNHYADRFDVRRHYRFNTRVDAARFDPETSRWQLKTDDGQIVSARHLVLATGQLSEARSVPFEGRETFEGQWLETSHWPTEPVDLAGKRVAVIGTGSSGVQAITEIAKVAESLHVFQRTPNYVVPSRNKPIDQSFYDQLASRTEEVWDELMKSPGAYAFPAGSIAATDMTPDEQVAAMEKQWAFGGLSMNFVFPDQRTNMDTNQLVSEFVRQKVRETVADPETAEALLPNEYPIGVRRLAVCNDYYETYNRDNVTLVNLKKEQIVRITPTGILTTEREYEFDVIVSALGFHAFTGAVDAIDMRNQSGERPGDHWVKGPSAFLGLMMAGFPNVYFLTGPGSPAVLANMNVGNVHHVDFVANLARFMNENGYLTVEPSPQAQEAYRAHTQEISANLIRKAWDNYMTHVNEDGSRHFVPYSGGFARYAEIVAQVEDDEYTSLVFGGDDREPVAVGVTGAAVAR